MKHAHVNIYENTPFMYAYTHYVLKYSFYLHKFLKYYHFYMVERCVSEFPKCCIRVRRLLLKVVWERCSWTLPRLLSCEPRTLAVPYSSKFYWE